MNTVIQARLKQQTHKTEATNINEVLFTIGVILGVTVLVQLASNYLYLDDLFGVINAKEATLAQSRTQNERTVSIQNNYSKLLVDSAKAESDYQSLQTLIPQKAELQKIQDWISQTAYARNLRLENFEKFSPQQKAGQLEQVAVKVVVSGQSSQITKLLADFARYERILLVEHVKLTEKDKSPDGKEILSHKAEVTFNAFLATDNGKLKPKTN